MTGSRQSNTTTAVCIFKDSNVVTSVRFILKQVRLNAVAVKTSYAVNRVMEDTRSNLENMLKRK